MNGAHWHLVLNHIPVLSTFFAAGFLMAGIFGSSRPIRRAGLILIVFAMASVIPTVTTGEAAEEIVEKMGISHDVIHEHEEKAELAQWLMIGLGILGIATLIAEAKRVKVANMLLVATLVGALGTGVVLIDVATSGGQIRHPEIYEAGAGGQDTFAYLYV